MRQWTLKILLALVGLALLAGLYPLAGALMHPRTTDISVGDQMILGIYFPIGVFLLLAARHPASNRSLILAFAWSTLAHAAVMLIQAMERGEGWQELPGMAVLAAICVALLVLAPRKNPAESAPVRSDTPRSSSPAADRPATLC